MESNLRSWKSAGLMVLFFRLLIAVRREPGLGEFFSCLPARDVKRDDSVLGRIADESQRLAAVGDDTDLLLQQAPIEHDAAVGGAEIFFRPVEDRSLRLPRHHVLTRE